MTKNSNGFSLLITLATVVAVSIFAVVTMHFLGSQKNEEAGRQEGATDVNTISTPDSVMYQDDFLELYFYSSMNVDTSGERLVFSGFEDSSSLEIRSYRQNESDQAKASCEATESTVAEGTLCYVSDVVPVQNNNFPEAKLVFVSQSGTSSRNIKPVVYLSNDPNVKTGDTDFAPIITTENNPRTSKVLVMFSGERLDEEYNPGTEPDNSYFSEFTESADYKKLLKVVESLKVK